MNIGHQHRLHLHRRNARRLGIAYWINMSAAAFWLAMIPVALLTPLKTSLIFLVGISLWALFAAHLSAALAAAAGKSANEVAITAHAPELPPGP